MTNLKTVQFCEIYGIEDIERFSELYEIDEIVLFLPPNPTDAEKQALQELVGLEGVTYGFMDYVKSNNTFELIMQWREQTGHM
jgi:hypothetical protein